MVQGAAGGDVPNGSVQGGSVNVVGVDLSTRTIDLVILDDDTNTARWVPVAIHDPRSTFEAARNVRTALAVAGVGSAVWDTVRLIGIEKPFSSSRASVYAYGVVVGALLACIPRGLEVYHLDPQVWRQEVGLPAKATKDDVAAWVRDERDGWEPHDPRFANWPQDAFDAYTIARAARSIKERAVAA